jgi:hypothetical protein
MLIALPVAAVHDTKTKQQDKNSIAIAFIMFLQDTNVPCPFGVSPGFPIHAHYGHTAGTYMRHLRWMLLIGNYTATSLFNDKEPIAYMRVFSK